MSKTSAENAITKPAGQSTSRDTASKATPGKTPLGKYGAVIQQARNEEGQKAIEPDNQIAGLPDEIKEEEVNLSIKVPLRLRRHWVAESKREGTTLTAVITAALSEKFGEPRDT